MSPDTIRELLVEYGGSGEAGTCVVIARAKRPPALSKADAANILWRDDVLSVSDLGQFDRRSLAIVFAQLEHLEKADAAHLLAQLRDRYAERTLVCDTQKVFTSAELLALGYIKQPRPRGGERLYLHDPEEFFERREWNDSRDWANPANFDKFRW